MRRRFLAKCGPVDSNDCIPWLAQKTSKGYGMFRIGGGGSLRTTAHRIAWALRNGDIPPGVLILHRCDNPSCVNPDHLFSGSAQENTDDMVGKKRHAWLNGQPWQKLNADDVRRAIDLRHAGHTQQMVADILGVSRPLISMIENGHIQHAQSVVSL